MIVRQVGDERTKIEAVSAALSPAERTTLSMLSPQTGCTFRDMQTERYRSQRGRWMGSRPNGPWQGVLRRTSKAPAKSSPDARRGFQALLTQALAETSS